MPCPSVPVPGPLYKRYPVISSLWLDPNTDRLLPRNTTQWCTRMSPHVAFHWRPSSYQRTHTRELRPPLKGVSPSTHDLVILQASSLLFDFSPFLRSTPIHYRSLESSPSSRMVPRSSDSPSLEPSYYASTHRSSLAATTDSALAS